MSAYYQPPQAVVINQVQTTTSTSSPAATTATALDSTSDAILTDSQAQMAQQPVSANNPCPFLRGLVAQGLLPDDKASLQAVVDAIHTIQQGQDQNVDGTAPLLPSPPIKAIAATANGFSPVQVAHNVRQGVQLNQLRHGPFDKEGAGSRILDTHGEYVQAELDRLASFATPKTDATGLIENGLNQQEIQDMLDANFERAKGQRRALDRTIMNGEFPVLLKILGKQGKNQQGEAERYLAVSDVERLFKERKFPERVAARINLAQK